MQTYNIPNLMKQLHFFTHYIKNNISLEGKNTFVLLPGVPFN